MAQVTRNQILQGDVIDIIKKISAESINCIVTSPPYYGLRNYDLPPTDWAEVSYAPMSGLPSLIIPPAACCLGLENSIEAYVGHMVLVFRGLWRVLRGDGVAWLNLGDSYASSPKGSIVTDSSTLSGSKTYQANGTPPNLLDKTKIGLKQKDLCGIPWRIAFALQADGWYLRSDIIWHKPNPMPESVTDRCTKSHEYLFLLTKKPKYWYDQDAIREPANYDGRKDTLMKGATKLKDIPGQSPNSMFTHGAEKWPNKTHDGLPGRNKRTVWSVATKSFKAAHFATFPPDLIEPCILAGCPSRVCVECEEPWVRVVEKTKYTPETVGEGVRNVDKSRGDRTRKLSGREYNKSVATKSLTFTPTCQCCPLPANKPGVVLDPFFGSGTVAEVAIKTKRDWLGVELNPEYIKLAKDRIWRAQPLLFPPDDALLVEAARAGFTDAVGL